MYHDQILYHDLPFRSTLSTLRTSEDMDRSVDTTMAFPSYLSRLAEPRCSAPMGLASQDGSTISKDTLHTSGATEEVGTSSTEGGAEVASGSYWLLLLLLLLVVVVVVVVVVGGFCECWKIIVDRCTFNSWAGPLCMTVFWKKTAITVVCGPLWLMKWIGTFNAYKKSTLLLWGGVICCFLWILCSGHRYNWARDTSPSDAWPGLAASGKFRSHLKWSESQCVGDPNVQQTWTEDPPQRGLSPKKVCCASMLFNNSSRKAT